MAEIEKNVSEEPPASGKNFDGSCYIPKKVFSDESTPPVKKKKIHIGQRQWNQANIHALIFSS